MGNAFSTRRKRHRRAAFTSPSPDGRIGIARLPSTRPSPNPSAGLLDAALSDLGLDIVDDARLALGWLWRFRGSVRFLHFHWRPDRCYAYVRPIPPGEAVRRPRVQRARSWLRLVAFTLRLTFARRLGYRIVWTIHEVYPPETRARPPGTISRRLDRAGERTLIRASALLLAHDTATAQRARTELGVGDRPIEVVPHGSYIGAYPSGRPRAAVREELSIPPQSFVFLCFGDLRPDKSVGMIVRAFAKIDRRDLALVVAGRVDDEDSARILAAAASEDPRIELLLGEVPAARVAELHRAADAGILARSEIWTSGSLILALSLGLPMVAARLPPHEELLMGGEAGWLFAPGDCVSLRRALEEAAANPGAAREKGLAARRSAERLPTWPANAQRIAALLKRAHLTGRS